MIKKTSILIVVLLAISIVSPAQTTRESDIPSRMEEIRQLRGRAEQSPAITEPLKSQILELCDGALAALQTVVVYQREGAVLQKDRAGVARVVEALRAELAKPEATPELDPSVSITVAQSDDALTRERSRLAAYRSALRDAERRVEERAKLRSEIAQRLGSLDQEVEALDDELVTGVERYSNPDLRTAARLNALARREMALSEIQKNRASLELLDDRGGLLPLEVDLAQRRVVYSDALVAMMSEQAAQLRREEAQASLAQVRELCQRAAVSVPELAELATETEGYAELLWGRQGVVTLTEAATASLVSTRRHLADLTRIAELSRRKFEAYGQRGSATRWWPDIPADFPKPGAVANTVRRLDSEIPEVSHRLITFEQQRAKTTTLTRTTRTQIQSAYGESPSNEVATAVRALLAARRDLLDRLIQQYGRYSNVLVEHRGVSQHFTESIDAVQHFLYTHVLWVRSVPRPIIPRPGDLVAAFRWLVNPTRGESPVAIGSEDGLKVRPVDILFLLGSCLVLVSVRRIGMRLAELADRVEDPERDAFRYTVEALMLTALLAAPLPVVLYVGSNLLERAGSTTPLTASAGALAMVTLIAAVLEFIRQLFTPRGLAEAHFSWPLKVTRLLHRGLLVPEAVAIPLLYVAIYLAKVGIRLDSPLDLQTYNNSLGRVAFILGLGFLGVTVLLLLRPERKDDVAEHDPPVIWSKVFSKYAFPTAVLVAYPLIFLGAILPAILAIFGFYVTGILLAYQMLRTITFGIAVLVGGGLIHRWRVASRRNALRDAGGKTVDDGTLKDISAAEAQTRQLFRFVAAAVMTIGLFSIWSDALPLFQMLKRVQMWPRVTLMEPVQTNVLDSVTVGRQQETGQPDQADAPPPEAAQIPDAVEGVAGDAQAGPAAADSPLTLWNLLESILVGFVAFVLARNIPGLLELFLRRRTTIDSGARVAFATLVRYAITIIGLTLVFGLLGISWSKVQWLAAALTFGLGFGLQEIVANFVSGLILLVERPVRVGDVVTIGNLMGKVTRIQIRATTITLWDRSEMIVPNKEFITTKLVNWTLSDSKRRIEIPLRIAYGADLKQVKEILTEIGDRHPDVLEDPAPHALVLGFGEDAIAVELRFVVDFGMGLRVKDEVQMSIDKAFRKAGIEFALPQRRIQVISGPPLPTDTGDDEPDEEGAPEVSPSPAV